MEIREFDIREADWNADSEALSEIRRIVFIVGQGVPKSEEWDGKDDSSWHWLASSGDNPIGTARLLPDGQIGRMAVIDDWRGAGVGAALLERAVDKARHLGFSSVFLNAQTHALGFYERAGFKAEGDEFMEAGIPHLRMTRALEPLPEAGRKFVSGPVPDVAIREFDVAETEWNSSGKIIRKIRQQVLAIELGLGADSVTDPGDSEAIHFQAVAPSGEIVGAVRMSLDGLVSRLAVIDSHRRQGVGHALIELAVGKAQRFGLREVRLMALTRLDRFYRDEGFLPRGEPFEQHGHEHQEYYRPLVSENVFERVRSPLSGVDYDPASLTYHLGEDDRLLLLRKEEEFANVIPEMCVQATQSLRIWSPVLEHKLFDSEQLRGICSALARRNKYTRIEILVYDPHRIIKHGHALLELSRRLPSSMAIRVVDPELRQLNHEFVIADQIGLVYRHDADAFEGYANFNDQTEANRFTRMFRSAWESGLRDPNLRQLRI